MPATAHELPVWESLDLLAEHGIGRLCIIDGGHPIAVPVNYRLVTSPDVHPRIVIRTAPDTMVGRYHGPCALEVDDIDLQHRRAWSVIARGTLEAVHGPHQLPDPSPIVAGSRPHWMVVDVAAISGRRFVIGEADDGWSVDWQMA